MTIFFIGDTHFGHENLAKDFRGFDSVEEHDDTMVELWNMVVTKKDIVWLLGDVAWSTKALHKAFGNGRLRGQKMLVLGNHDKSAKIYAEYFHSIFGLRKFKKLPFGKGTAWLSHAPMHPQEVFRCEYNIHGHIHDFNLSLGDPYINVNADALTAKWTPIALDDLNALKSSQTNKAQDLGH